MSLGRSGDAYLVPGATLGDRVATRTIAAGELVPAAATAPAAQSEVTTVVVRSSVTVPRSVVAGTAVDLWAAAPTEDGGFDPPRILIPNATVASITHDDSMIGGGADAIELVIPRADVAAALEAVADESALSVVAAGGR